MLVLPIKPNTASKGKFRLSGIGFSYKKGDLFILATAAQVASVTVPSQPTLLNNHKLEEIIESALFASWSMPNGNKILPVGLMLVSKSGLGKSKTIFQYAFEPRVKRADSLTGAGIIDIMESDRDNQVKFIMHGDFNEALSHKTSVVSLMSATLLSAMSDGVVSIDDGRRNKSVPHNPIGLITGMTHDMYVKNERKWAALGLSRRFLFVFYRHSITTEEKIQTEIRNGNQSNAPIPLHKFSHFPPKGDAMVMIPPDEAVRIENYSNKLSVIRSLYPALVREGKSVKLKSVQREAEAPYTCHHMLRALACGHAMRRGNFKEVEPVDVDFVRNILEFCDWNTPKEI